MRLPPQPELARIEGRATGPAGRRGLNRSKPVRATASPLSSSDGEPPASSPTTVSANSKASRPIKSVAQFTAAMLEGAREMYQGEATRREVAAGLS